MKVIGIVGPTAVGKSALAIKLAKEFNGEIISCDSMQIYKGMDIGTAKPTKEETEQIKHHLIDIKSPNENFSCADYALYANECIKDILNRSKTPIFCGGTGLYLDSVIEIQSFSSSCKDEEYRKYLEDLAKREGNEKVYNMLLDIDPESALATHQNNLKRVIRALEIYNCTGVTKSEWDKRSKEEKPPYESEVFFLTCEDRNLLYKRIEKRVDLMVENGLVLEAENLYKSGMLNEKYTSYAAIGYKEFIPYFEGKITLNEALEKIKISTRQYAKRQLTWFSRKENYHKIYVDKQDAFAYVIEYLRGLK